MNAHAESRTAAEYRTALRAVVRVFTGEEWPGRGFSGGQDNIVGVRRRREGKREWGGGGGRGRREIRVDMGET